ncbi:MAG: hypothetical protein ACPGSL_00410 [Vicingaceae bacterium]
MKAQLILFLLLFCTIGTEAFATEKEPKQEEKKTVKSKYDFNIFKLYAIVNPQPLADTLKVNTKLQPQFIKED